MYEWKCPLCGRGGLFVRASDKSIPTGPGSGTSVCTRCAKKRADEIKQLNALYYGDGRKKDPNCEHKWVNPYPNRWYCLKCGAQFNVMCECGGSMYMCDKHYHEFIHSIDDMENYLAEHSW